MPTQSDLNCRFELLASRGLFASDEQQDNTPLAPAMFPQTNTSSSPLPVPVVLDEEIVHASTQGLSEPTALAAQVLHQRCLPHSGVRP